MTEPDFYILGAEHVGEARLDDGVLRIGTPDENGNGVVEVRAHLTSVYVRRASDDLSVIEVHLASHDGLAQEELDRQNAEAERYPLGPKEYWRAEMVGKYTFGSDGHLMTDEEFESDWEENEEQP